MRYEVADGVATLTLDKPDARNVLDAETMAALSDDPVFRRAVRRAAFVVRGGDA